METDIAVDSKAIADFFTEDKVWEILNEIDSYEKEEGNNLDEFNCLLTLFRKYHNYYIEDSFYKNLNQLVRQLISKSYSEYALKIISIDSFFIHDSGDEMSLLAELIEYKDPFIYSVSEFLDEYDLTRSLEGLSPSEAAVYGENFEYIEYLIKERNIKTSEMCSGYSLMQECALHNVDTVRFAGKYSSANEVGFINMPPVNLAVKYEKSDVVRLLLEMGADPNIPDDYGLKALDYSFNAEIYNLIKSYGGENSSHSVAMFNSGIIAVEDNNPVELARCVRVICTLNNPVFRTERYDLLEGCVRLKLFDSAKMLIEAGALHDYKRGRLLDKAIGTLQDNKDFDVSELTEFIEYLSTKGYAEKIGTSIYKGPLSTIGMCRDYYNDITVEDLIKLFSAIEACGCPINLSDVMDEGLKYKMKGFVVYCFNNGFDIKAYEKDRGRGVFHKLYSFLFYEFDEKNTKTFNEICKMLFDAGADINKKDDASGETCLFSILYTSSKFKKDFIISALQNGADKTVKDNYFKTPYDVAKELNCNKEILDLLKV